MRSRLVLCATVILALAGGCHKTSAATQDCNNYRRDGSETDVDCGGPICAACGTGKSCRVDKDCVSKLCNSDSKCSAAACSDGIKNGSETDIDCGGPDCLPCAKGKTCYATNDCQSTVCDVDAGCQ
jgi:hypothetical protein